MKILFSKKCLEFWQPGHPESPDRVRMVYEFLNTHKNFNSIEPEPCTEKDILLAHSRNLLNQVKNGNFFDSDTPRLPSIFDYAKLSAGSAIQAAKLALEEEETFSLMRPPGHHAGRDSLGGFCYFNNIAIAAARILKKAKRVAILDIDCHFGQGTQEIFFGNEKVLCVSLHQYGIYPGGGKYSDKNCLNYPMNAGTGESEYLEKLKIAIEKIKKFNPGLLAISVGFDTYKEDPLTNINLEIKSYSKITKIINEIEKPKFAVLGGGYSNELHLCVYEFLKNF
ncbi:MAG: histone deacetylase [Candidatus Aenigmarchaeota archaeon]|nr:histone deacetylase [Candidatus Aenigmarchaeota archaeon]